jgi:hypothetical protein
VPYISFCTVPRLYYSSRSLALSSRSFSSSVAAGRCRPGGDNGAERRRKGNVSKHVGGCEEKTQNKDKNANRVQKETVAYMVATI